MYIKAAENCWAMNISSLVIESILLSIQCCFSESYFLFVPDIFKMRTNVPKSLA